MNTNSIRNRLMAVRFALWDLHLYEATHGCDCVSKELCEKYKRKYAELLREYESKYGPLTVDRDEDCLWAATPFPWVNCGGDC